MTKVEIEDSVRRSLLTLDENSSVRWQQNSSEQVYGPLLSVPWIVDADTTIKTLHGKQEGTEVSYNTHKPSRPSHTYHTDMIANLRLILGVEVYSGKQVAAKHRAP